jgi:hypothetical protein
MLRLIGFLLGIGLIAIPLALLLPAPQTPPEAGTPTPVTQVPAMPEPTAEAAAQAAAQAPAPPATDAADSPAATVPEQREESVAIAETAPDTGAEVGAEGPADDPAETAVPADDPLPSVAAADEPRRTQIIWSPFRSEPAANGFARRLTAVSGVDVTVSSTGNGLYFVGFDYVDDIHRNWCLGQIQARTGLDLSKTQTPPAAAETRTGWHYETHRGVADRGI